MAEINRSIIFSAVSTGTIHQVTRRPGFTHKNWGDKELIGVRREIRNFYRREQQQNCMYCRGAVAVRSAVGAPVEHIAPKSAYPEYMFEPLNLCVSCPDCNEFKAERETIADPAIKNHRAKSYPTDSGKFRIFHPHFDSYRDHILHAGIFYFENTPKGGHTIYVCNLGRFLNAYGMSDELMNDLTTLSQRHRFHGG